MNDKILKIDHRPWDWLKWQGVEWGWGSFQFYLQVTATREKKNKKSIMEKKNLSFDCIAFEGLDGSKQMCTLEMVLCLATLLRCAWTGTRDLLDES